MIFKTNGSSKRVLTKSGCGVILKTAEKKGVEEWDGARGTSCGP